MEKLAGSEIAHYKQILVAVVVDVGKDAGVGLVDPIEPGFFRGIFERNSPGFSHSIVAVQAAPLAVREENIREPVIVVVNRAHATESVLHYTEFQMHFRRLNVQLWVSLVLEVYADRCWIQFSESSAITSYANSLHQLVLHDLPVISVATFVREIPAIEVAVLENRADLIGSVEYEFHRQNRAPLELDI